MNKPESRSEFLECLRRAIATANELKYYLSIDENNNVTPHIDDGFSATHAFTRETKEVFLKGKLLTLNTNLFTEVLNLLPWSKGNKVIINYLKTDFHSDVRGIDALTEELVRLFKVTGLAYAIEDFQIDIKEYGE